MARALGLDIGSDAVKAVLVERKGSAYRLLRARRLGWDELGERGVEPGDEAGLARVVQLTLRQEGWKSAEICLALTSRQAMQRFVHLPVVPSWRLKLIMSYETGQVAEQTGEELSSDYRLVRVPEPDDQSECLVLLAMARDREIDGRLSAYTQLRLPIHGVLPAGIAAFDAVSVLSGGLLEPDETTLYLEVGHEQTELVIGRGKDFIFNRALPFGMRQVADAVAEKRRLEPAEARELLRTDPAKAAADAGSAMEKLVQAVMSAFPYCKQQTKWSSMKPDALVLSGGGAHFGPLGEMLEDRLGIKVSRVDFSDFVDTGGLPEDGKALLEESGATLTVALGLAVSRLSKDAFDLDLLPNEFKKKRRFRTRTVYLIGAGLLLVLYLTWGLVASYLELSEARDRGTALKKQLSGIIGTEEENELLREANVRRWELLESLSRRSDVGYAANRLLLLCIDRIPAKVRLGRYDVRRDDDSGAMVLLLEGEADNRDAKGWDRLEAFKAALEDEDEVAEVKDADARADEARATVRYVLQVMPVLRD